MKLRSHLRFYYFNNQISFYHIIARLLHCHNIRYLVIHKVQGDRYTVCNKLFSAFSTLKYDVDHDSEVIKLFSCSNEI